MFDDSLPLLWRFKLFLSCPTKSSLIGCHLPFRNTFFQSCHLFLGSSQAGLLVVPWTHSARNLQIFSDVFPLLGWPFLNLCVSSFHLVCSSVSPQKGLPWPPTLIPPPHYYVLLFCFIFKALFTTWKYFINLIFEFLFHRIWRMCKCQSIMDIVSIIPLNISTTNKDLAQSRCSIFLNKCIIAAQNWRGWCKLAISFTAGRSISVQTN